MNHTPEPRTVRNFDDAQVVVLSGNKLVGVFTGPNLKRNAALDAAAPDLLDELLSRLDESTLLGTSFGASSPRPSRQTVGSGGEHPSCQGATILRDCGGSV